MSLIFKRLIAVVAILFSTVSFADSHDHYDQDGEGGRDILDHMSPIEAHHKKDFNAGDMILEHVMDQHTIHFGSYHMPLPIILFDDGLQVFSSAHFYHHPHSSEFYEDGELRHAHYYLHDDYLLFKEKVHESYFEGLVFDNNKEFVLNSSADNVSETDLDLSDKNKKKYEYELYGEKKSFEYFETDKYVVVDHNVYNKRIDGLVIANGKTFNSKILMDLSITKNVAGMILGFLITIIIFFTVAKAYKKRKGKSPTGFQNAVESLIVFIRDEVAKPTIGHGYARYMPFLLTIFFFILVCNLLGLIPFLGGLNVTGNISVTLVLATFVFLIQIVVSNKGFWSHIVLPPGVPAWLLPLMVPIEIIGLFSKPIVLMLRLFANITAGHIIILAFVSLTFIFAAMEGWLGFVIGPVSAILAGLMSVLEVLVALLQAYVFTLLAAIYFGMATEEAHH